ncbi:C-type lectin domain family 4 member E isoform X1 [Alligator mississippiensis]|uniref:C-type lectin domain family 4 member E isoform X1 n=2 Tax=Alligator mississippiensis TaxID=8496 RepID=UPI000711500C|nr:C-type lectin domain family 4 member E isoform X1 [Alligator mississippiensis]
MSMEGRPNLGAPAEERGGCPRLSSWAVLIPALIFKACITCGCLVILHKQSHEAHRTLPETFPEWHCAQGMPGSKELVWTCCPMGWKAFQTSCYYFSSDVMSWDDSEKNCTAMGSHLVVINTKAEQDFLLNWVKEMLADLPVKMYYIGLTAQEAEGQWCWVDHTPYNKNEAFWKPGEPSDPILEPCTALQVNSKKQARENWNDLACFTDLYRICESAPTCI